MPSPSLSESDARSMARALVAQIRALGGTVSSVGIDLARDGFCFRAMVNGRDVWAFRGQGSWHYRDIARELMATVQHPDRVAGGDFLPPLRSGPTVKE